MLLLMDVSVTPLALFLTMPLVPGPEMGAAMVSVPPLARNTTLLVPVRVIGWVSIKVPLREPRTKSPLARLTVIPVKVLLPSMFTIGPMPPLPRLAPWFELVPVPADWTVTTWGVTALKPVRKPREAPGATVTVFWPLPSDSSASTARTPELMLIAPTRLGLAPWRVAPWRPILVIEAPAVLVKALRAWYTLLGLLKKKVLKLVSNVRFMLPMLTGPLKVTLPFTSSKIVTEGVVACAGLARVIGKLKVPPVLSSDDDLRTGVEGDARRRAVEGAVAAADAVERDAGREAQVAAGGDRWCRRPRFRR